MSLTATEAASVHKEADCLATASDIDQALCQMADAITERIGDQAPLVLCVMNGGVIPTAQLTLKLNFPLEIDYLHATRYGMDTTGGKLRWKVYPSTPLQGRTILVVDDIFDQGHTLKAICSYLKEQGAEQVLSAVVINKRHDRKVAFQPDFIGMEIEDRFLYGFGMDYKGFYRNIDGVYAVSGL